MGKKMTTDENMMGMRHYRKVCSCGCGVEFGTNRPYALYASSACRVRANRKKHKGVPKTLLGVDLGTFTTKQVREAIEQLEQIAAWEKAQKNYLVYELVNSLVVSISGKSKKTAVDSILRSNDNDKKLGIKPKQKQLTL